MSRIDESTDRPLGREDRPTDAENIDLAGHGSVRTDDRDPEAPALTDDPAANGSALADDRIGDGSGRADEPSGARQDSAAARLGADTVQPEPGDVEGRPEALISADRSADHRARWDVIKGQFVDDPRSAVQNANTMVGEILDELEELFGRQRSELEQGLKDERTSTEDLRLALRRYRSFFDRLLSV